MKPITHKLIVIGVFLAIVAVATLAVVFLTPESSEEEEFDSTSRFAYASVYDPTIEGCEVGAFETYDAFCASKWANVILDGRVEPIKDVYYTEGYFKTKNLVIFAFNKEYAHLDFEIVDERISEGKCDISAVALYSVPSWAENKDENGNIIMVDGDGQTYTVPPEPKNYVGTQAVENQKIDTTYFYLYETEDPLAEEYAFTIVAERFFGINSNLYVKNNLEPVLIPGEETPVVFRFSSFEEANVFVSEDPYIKRMDFFLYSIKAFVTNGISDHDVIVVRYSAPAVEFTYDFSFERQGAYLEGTELILWEVDSPAASPSKGDASYVVMFTVPKDASIDTLRWVSYRGKDAPQPRIEDRTYNLVRDDGSAIQKYNTEIQP